MKLPEKITIFRKFALKNRHFLWNYLKKSTFFRNLPWKSKYFVKLLKNSKFFRNLPWKLKSFVKLHEKIDFFLEICPGKLIFCLWNCLQKSNSKFFYPDPRHPQISNQIDTADTAKFAALLFWSTTSFDKIIYSEQELIVLIILYASHIAHCLLYYLK